MALLRHRNTPVSGLSSSPEQLLMSRMLRDKLPVAHNDLKRKLLSGAQKQLHARQALQKHHYDQHAKSLPTLNTRDMVRIRRGRLLEPAVVTQSSLLGRPAWSCNTVESCDATGIT